MADELIMEPVVVNSRLARLKRELFEIRERLAARTGQRLPWLQADCLEVEGLLERIREEEPEFERPRCPRCGHPIAGGFHG